MQSLRERNTFTIMSSNTFQYINLSILLAINTLNQTMKRLLNESIKEQRKATNELK